MSPPPSEVCQTRRSYSDLASLSSDATVSRDFRPFCAFREPVIDHHYGHHARDGREHAIRLLDTLSAAETKRWTLVDAAWTPKSSNVVDSDNGNIS
jgi:hypothetical protein